jgi:hypothetical protein
MQYAKSTLTKMIVSSLREGNIFFNNSNVPMIDVWLKTLLLPRAKLTYIPVATSVTIRISLLNQ